jgi:hypothetical protein
MSLDRSGIYQHLQSLTSRSFAVTMSMGVRRQFCSRLRLVESYRVTTPRDTVVKHRPLTCVERYLHPARQGHVLIFLGIFLFSTLPPIFYYKTFLPLLPYPRVSRVAQSV